VSHCIALPFYIKKVSEEGKGRIMKIQILHHARKYNLQKKNLLKKNPNPSR
jgi:hypothetical protein